MGVGHIGRVVWLVGAWAALGGCDLGGGPREPGLHGDLEGGLLTTTATPYDVVFSIARPDRVNVGLALCAGTLVAPTLLLTAAHCVTIERGDGGYVLQDAGEFFVNNGAVIEQLGDELAVDEIIVHPDYVAGSAFRDLALVRLDQDARPWTGGQLMEVGRWIEGEHLDMARGADIVGYGGDAYPDAYAPREQSGDYARLHLPHQLSGFGCDLDDLACAANDVVLSFDNSPEAGFCGGDGGGPVLLFRDAAGDPAPAPWQYLESDSPIPDGGTAFIAGIVSRVVTDDDCNGVGLVARTDTAMDFLEPYLAE